MACKVAFVGVVLATGAIGCAEEEPEPTFDPDSVVTIEQGVYGKATLIFCTKQSAATIPSGTRLRECSAVTWTRTRAMRPWRRRSRTIAASSSSSSSRASTRSASRSFHQLPCVVFTLESGELERIDFQG